MQIKLDNIQKYYKVGKEKLHILKSLSLEIEEGEFIMIMGKYGSGKTTRFTPNHYEFALVYV